MNVSLMTETQLTFYRPQGSEYFVGGRPVKAPNIKIPNVWGSLHPYKEGKKTRTLPEGKTSSDAWIFRTKVALNPVDPFKKVAGDITTIDGNIYYVFDVEDWTRRGLSLSHYKCILVRKDQQLGTE